MHIDIAMKQKSTGRHVTPRWQIILIYHYKSLQLSSLTIRVYYL